MLGSDITQYLSQLFPSHKFLSVRPLSGLVNLKIVEFLKKKGGGGAVIYDIFDLAFEQLCSNIDGFGLKPIATFFIIFYMYLG